MADKKFTLQFDASMDIAKIQQALKTVQNDFGKLQVSASTQKSFNSLFSNLENSIKDFEAKTAKGINSMSDFRSIETSGKKIINLYERLKVEVKSISKLTDSELLKVFPDTLNDSFREAQRSLSAYEKKLGSVNSKVKAVQKNLESWQDKEAKARRKDPTGGKTVISSSDMDILKTKKSQARKGFQEAEKQRIELEEEIQKRIAAKQMKITKKNQADKRYGNFEENQKILDDVEKAKQTYEKFKKAFDDWSAKISSSITQEEHSSNINEINADIKEAQEKIVQYKTEIEKLGGDEGLSKAFSKIREEVSKLTGADLSVIPQTAKGLEEIQEALENFRTSKISEVRQETENFSGAVKQAAPEMDNLTDKINEFGKTAEDMSRASQEVESLKNSILDFFSITNTIQIFKNAVRDAYDTVKELDRAMTETAVVTDFSIGDMWEQLPRYTEAANKLGTTTLGAYETMTLFYQQGLKTNETFEVGTETMKMARIAGLEYAEATNLMTAALRGFNMELNQNSAQRVNDVYSELAAITAADTEEIARAMTKTASIAHSANMEFETTAAFLSQIIETTRESAETAGTAMKTVIARFQELTKNPDEIGEVDGEIVDANKIETALRTVGVALRDAQGQFRNLDEVFLELASKWDTLDRNTQRYIATIAAGSRQQSRFLAMMSNYDRTIELVNAANTSAGASAQQFEKTIDSLESKLNKLTNAWNQFTMGLADNEAIKGSVDLLTGLFSTINNLTEKMGPLSNVAKLLLTLGALKGGSMGFEHFFAAYKKNAGPDMEHAFTGFGKTVVQVWKEANAGVATFSKNGVTKIGALLKQTKELNLSVTGLKGAFVKLGSGVLSTGKAILGLIGPIGAVVIALGALYFAYKKMQEYSPEGRLQAASEAAAQAAEAADEAAAVFNSLNDSLNGLEDKYKSIEELTRGTLEWKKAAKEINKEILDLINKYPELNKLIDRTSTPGLLKLDSDSKEVQDVLSLYAMNEVKASNAAIVAKIAEQQAQQNVDYSQLSYNAKIQKAAQTIPVPYGIAEPQGIVVDDKLTVQIAKDIIEKGLTREQVNQELNNQAATSLSQEAFEELRKFGEKLLEAEEVIDSFTRATVTNTLANIDASKYTQQQMKSAENYMNSDRVSSLYNEQLSNIQGMNKSQLKDAKEEYAKIMQYSYEGGKFYTGTGADKKEVKVSDFKEQYAMIKATESMTVEMERFISVISKGSERAQKIYEQSEGGALTKADLDSIFSGMSNILDENGNITEEAKANLRNEAAIDWTKLGSEGQIMFNNDFENYLKDYMAAVEASANTYAEATEKIKSAGISKALEEQFSHLSSGAYKGISDKIYDVFLTTGSEGVEKISSLITELIPEGMEEQFITALNSIEWDDINSIEGLKDVFNRMGITVGKGTEDIKRLEEAIKACANVTREWNLDNLKTKLQSLRELSDDIAERDDSDRTFNQKQVDAILEASPEFANNFIMTGIDEFVFIGDSMNSLEDAVRKLESAIISEYNDKITQDAQRAMNWKNLMQYDETSSAVNKAVNNEELTEKEIAIIDQTLSRLGLSTEGDLTARTQRLTKDYDSYYGTNGSIAESKIAAQESRDQNLLQMKYAKKTGFDILQTEANTPEEIKAQEQALDALIVSENGLSKAVEQTKERLKEQGIAIADNEKLVKALGVDSFKASQNIKELCEEIEKNTNALESSDTSSVEYLAALEKISDVAREVFGDNITSDFIEQNKTLFAQLAEGGEIGSNAFLAIQDAARQAELNTLEAEGRIAGGIQELEDMLAQADLDFQVNGTADLTPLIEAFLQAGYTADETKAKIEALTGSMVEFEVDYQDMEVPVGTISGFDPKEGFMTGGSARGPEKAAFKTQTIRVPKSIRGVGKKKEYSSSGYTPKSSKGGGGGGGGGGGSKEEPWKNPYDKLYNLTEKINEQMRIREKIERRYDAILKSRLTTAKALRENSLEEISALEKEANLQKEMLSGREKQMEEHLSKNSSMSKYGTYDSNAGVIRIDWDAINAVTDQDKGAEIEEYIGKLEEIQGQIEETEDALTNIEDRLEEIRSRGEDEYFELEDRIKDAIINARQEEIDKLSAINDSINDTNSKLLEAMQNSIDKMRQDRDNQKTEDDLAEKQRMLAYLQQDTSGANDMAILDLQKEIEEGQQSYTDALIDQKISELQEQNDKAAQQRDQQIAIMSTQLEFYQKTGEVWNDAYALMEDGLNSDHGLIRGSKLEQILQNAESWQGMSALGKMKWLEELEDYAAQAINYLKVGRQLEHLEMEGKEVTFTTSDGKQLSGKVDKSGNVTVDGKTYSGIYQHWDGSYRTDEGYKGKVEPPKPAPKPSNPNTSSDNWSPAVGDLVRIKSGAKFNDGQDIIESVRSSGVIDGKHGGFKILKDGRDFGHPGSYYVGRSWTSDGVTGLLDKKYLTKYKTGGVADFTGPAWLDGTKSKPELILNARDTENFIQLKNVLASLMSHMGSSSRSSEISGDNTYDIDINVESIGSDYDVEQLANKVKTMINQNARYRNNNTISLMR